MRIEWAGYGQMRTIVINIIITKIVPFYMTKSILWLMVNELLKGHALICHLVPWTYVEL